MDPFELQEMQERRPDLTPPDPVSEVVGEAQYVAHHRFAECFVETGHGRSPRLRVSRYYWGAEPPVVVDFARDIPRGERGRLEVGAKFRYCTERGIRYVLAADQFDEDRVRAALAPAGAADALADAPMPVTAPRRKRA